MTELNGMLEENVAVPFDTKVLGVIDLLDLPLPAPPPPGAEWIAAYRHWAR